MRAGGGHSGLEHTSSGSFSSLRAFHEIVTWLFNVVLECVSLISLESFWTFTVVARGRLPFLFHSSSPSIFGLQQSVALLHVVAGVYSKEVLRLQNEAVGVVSIVTHRSIVSVGEVGRCMICKSRIDMEIGWFRSS